MTDNSEAERVCFLLRIDPNQIPEYLHAHQNVPPPLLLALQNAGYRNYSVFVDASGLLVGYFETDDAEKALATMKANPINDSWGKTIEPMFMAVDDSRPVGTVLPLRLAFNLESAVQ
jgi:L-rhamnose mutarotase